MYHLRSDVPRRFERDALRVSGLRGNKFQFKPAGETSAEQRSPAGNQPSNTDPQSPDANRQSPDANRQSAPVDEGAPDESAGRVTDTPAPDSQRSDSQPSEARTPDAGTPESETPDAQKTDSEHVRDRTEEDVAQASARSDVVSPDELDRASRDIETDSSSTGSDPDTPTDPEGPRPDIDDLRDELNEQFESIRIVSPGKYELNLMELYDRQEYIISLQEDGRYVIEMPDAWGIISDE